MVKCQQDLAVLMQQFKAGFPLPSSRFCLESESDQADQLGIGEVVKVIHRCAEDFGFGEFLNTCKRLDGACGRGNCVVGWHRAEAKHPNNRCGRGGGQTGEWDRG